MFFKAVAFCNAIPLFVYAVEQIIVIPMVGGSPAILDLDAILIHSTLILLGLDSRCHGRRLEKKSVLMCLLVGLFFRSFQVAFRSFDNSAALAWFFSYEAISATILMSYAMLVRMLDFNEPSESVREDAQQLPLDQVT